MNDPVPIGFVGGCLIAQPGISRSRLFHRIFAHRCRTELGVPIRVSLEEYFRYSECRDRVRGLIERRRPAFLVFSLRPQPLLALAKPSIRYVTAAMEVARVRHPALWRKGLDVWRLELDRRDDRPRSGGSWESDPMRSAGAECHLLLGCLLRLDDWARRYALRELERVQSACAEFQVTLTVLGIPANPASWVGHRICRSLNRQASAACHDAGVLYVDCFATEDSLGRCLFAADRLHLNECGHAFVADQLLSGLSCALSSLPAHTVANQFSITYEHSSG